MYGGLGNQCFIYATARALADRVHGSLRLDPTVLAFDKVYQRPFLLPEFQIRASDIVRKVSAWKLHLRRLHVRVQPRLPWRSNRWLFERTPARFQPEVVNWQGSRATLDGYWQTERYFEDAAAAICQDLTPREAAEFEASEVAARVRAAEHSVFLHVRSYREVPGRQDGSFALTAAYFRNAVEWMRSRLPNPVFFLFSDDPAWALERLPFLAHVACSVVPAAPAALAAPLSDFHVMTLCRHAIVANSSFSWWAAWLGEQRRLRSGLSGEIVRPAGHSPNPDYYPPRWHPVGVA